jgi:hypothetical protein
MQGHPSLDKSLVQAETHEKQYEWLQAVKSYDAAKARVLKHENFQKAGDIQERIGFCSQNAAMQAETPEEFRDQVQYAIEAYEKAGDLYQRYGSKPVAERKLRCDAIIKYLGYWLTSDPSEKRKLLDECLDLEGEALAYFSESEETVEYSKTYDDLALVFFLRVFLENDLLPPSLN